jgi:hypothetical protein
LSRRVAKLAPRKTTTKRSLNLPAVRRSFFTIGSDGKGKNVHVTFKGTADLRCQPALEDFLAALHSETVRLRANQVTLDIRSLEFMSSACFRQLVRWVSSVDDAERPYKISFLADPALQWQRRSMQALTRFAGDFVSVKR